MVHLLISTTGMWDSLMIPNINNTVCWWTVEAKLYLLQLKKHWVSFPDVWAGFGWRFTYADVKTNKQTNKQTNKPPNLVKNYSCCPSGSAVSKSMYWLFVEGNEAMLTLGLVYKNLSSLQFSVSFKKELAQWNLDFFTLITFCLHKGEFSVSSV